MGVLCSWPEDLTGDVTALLFFILRLEWVSGLGKPRGSVNLFVFRPETLYREQNSPCVHM